ncbi:MAG: YceD family protein [Leptolyngbyaceae bacterium]|nr:YceD family protein [Leptolyngbyaceae bacterium]
MDTIYIPKLIHAPEQTERLEFEESLQDLETLTPVKGQIQIKHQGNYLEVKAQAETIITLTCHRCLQHYNHRLTINASELIWLDESANESGLDALEQEVAFEDLVESLPPQGYFDPNLWLYEQLCLEIPQRQLCDLRCPGIQTSDQGSNLSDPQPVVDRRWASLEALKGKLPG